MTLDRARRTELYVTVVEPRIHAPQGPYRAPWFETGRTDSGEPVQQTQRLLLPALAVAVVAARPDLAVGFVRHERPDAPADLPSLVDVLREHVDDTSGAQERYDAVMAAADRDDPRARDLAAALVAEVEADETRHRDPWWVAAALLVLQQVLGEPALSWPPRGDGTSADEQTFLADLAAQPPETPVGATGWTAGAVYAFHRRPPSSPDVDYRAGVVYRTDAAGRDMKMHLFAPRASGARRPGVVFVHGGGWRNGSPAKHLRAAALLVERGWVTASIAYHLVPEARWPAQRDDVAAAIAWLRAHAGEIGLDPQRIGIAGDSAGGHLAADAATHPVPGSDVRAAVLLSPLLDLEDPALIVPGGRLVAALLDDPDPARRADASPLRHVSPTTAPILTIVGGNDTLTTAASARRFHDRLDAHGVTNRLEVWPGLFHAFEFDPTYWQRWFDACTAWLDEHVAGAAAQSVAETVG
jgi:acetyl esterase/lipase